MLYRLEIENFYSIRDRQVLDLIVDAKVQDPDGRYAPIFDGSKARVPKIVALYGANASGKTTVLRALKFLAEFIRDSVQYTGEGFLGLERFNDPDCAHRPIRFAVELGGVMRLASEEPNKSERSDTGESGTYRYELEIQVHNGAFVGIGAEALRRRANGQGRWQRVFERDLEGNVKGGRSFSLPGYRHLLKTLASNHSVLSSFAKFQHPAAQFFVNAVRKVIIQIEPLETTADQSVINYLQGQPSVLLKLAQELNRIDVGVEGLRSQDTPNGPQLMFKHAGLHLEMPWLLESHGTRAFIKMYPFIIQTLANGGLLLMDELDASIHPLVLPEILGWFYDSAERNPLNAQLWLSCHSASLLDSLNKEEIVLCEKNRHGVTSIYSLMDVDIRRDDNHYRKYLSGAYGGVPHIG